MICFNNAELNAYYSKQEFSDAVTELAWDQLTEESLYPECDSLLDQCAGYDLGTVTLEQLGKALLDARQRAVDVTVERILSNR